MVEVNINKEHCKHICIYGNVTMKPPEQLISVNKNVFFKEHYESVL
jgi:hypothetical protein